MPLGRSLNDNSQGRSRTHCGFLAAFTTAFSGFRAVIAAAAAARAAALTSSLSLLRRLDNETRAAAAAASPKLPPAAGLWSLNAAVKERPPLPMDGHVHLEEVTFHNPQGKELSGPKSTKSDVERTRFGLITREIIKRLRGHDLRGGNYEQFDGPITHFFPSFPCQKCSFALWGAI